MSGIGSTSLGSMFGWVPDMSPEEYQRLRVAEARRRWPQLRRERLEHRGRYIVDKTTGDLYERLAGAAFHQQPGLPDSADRAAAFFISEQGDAVLLSRPASRPHTLAQLQADEQARARAELDRAERHRSYLAAQPRRILTVADMDERRTLTLREAYETIVELGGTVEATERGFRVVIPQRYSQDDGDDQHARARVAEAALALDQARELVRERLEARRPLPDTPAPVGGG